MFKKNTETNLRYKVDNRNQYNPMTKDIGHGSKPRVFCYPKISFFIKTFQANKEILSPLPMRSTNRYEKKPKAFYKV